MQQKQNYNSIYDSQRHHHCQQPGKSFLLAVAYLVIKSSRKGFEKLIEELKSKDFVVHVSSKLLLGTGFLDLNLASMHNDERRDLSGQSFFTCVRNTLHPFLTILL